MNNAGYWIFRIFILISTCLSLLIFLCALFFSVRGVFFVDVGLWRRIGDDSYSDINILSGHQVFVIQYFGQKAIRRQSYVSDEKDGQSVSNEFEFGSRPFSEWSLNGRHWQKLGFSFQNESSRYMISGLNVQGTLLAVIVPYWFVLLASSTLPAIFIRRFYVLRRSLGRCSACGYDIRATPNRCSECGKHNTVSECGELTRS